MSSWVPLTVRLKVKERLKKQRENLNANSFSDVLENMLDFCDENPELFRSFIAERGK